MMAQGSIPPSGMRLWGADKQARQQVESVGPGGMTQTAPMVGLQTPQSGSVPAVGLRPQPNSSVYQRLASMFMPSEFPQFTGIYSTPPEQLMASFMSGAPQQTGYYQGNYSYYDPARAYYAPAQQMSSFMGRLIGRGI